MTDEEFLTVEEIAKILKVSDTTVRGFIRSKKLRGAKFGRDYRVRKADFDRFVQDQFGHDEQTKNE